MKARIHVYPGMGATSQMYSEVWRDRGCFVFHDWPEWRGEGTLPKLALRVIEEHRISPGDVIAGSSLGGIVACEISNFVRLKRLVLLGSAVHKKEINAVLAALHPLINLAPFDLLRICSGKIPHELAVMFSQSDSGFLRSMCKAVFSWEGLRNDVPVTRIHGRRDLVIPMPRVVDYSVRGGHLIAMTHAEACVSAIDDAIDLADFSGSGA